MQKIRLILGPIPKISKKYFFLKKKKRKKKTSYPVWITGYKPEPVG